MKYTKIKRTLIYWAGQLALVVLVTIVVSVLGLQTYDIQDVSMEPTFDSQGNRVIVFLLPSIFKVMPDYGDIVIIDSRVNRPRTIFDRIIESPLPALLTRPEQEHMWVKRVIAVPGDTIAVINGEMILNGLVSRENYIKERMTFDFEALTVPEGHVFVMGDNRNHSSDSRQIGPVPVSNIQGRVVMRLFPLDKITTY